jgi:cytochrome c556
MRWIIVILLAGAALAQAPTYQPVGNMKQLMIDIIYPTSDALFYIERTPPKTEVDWNGIRNQALMLAESGNLILMPGRSREGGWEKDTKMMIDAAKAAYRAAMAKDMAGVLAQADSLAASCIACHKEYRPNYGK